MILIVGGLGFIGVHATRELIEHGHEVAVTRFRSNRDEALLDELFGGRARVVQLDVTDGQAVNRVFDDLGVTSVLDLLAPPPGAWSAPEEYRANMVGLGNLLEAGLRVGVTRMTL